MNTSIQIKRTIKDSLIYLPSKVVPAIVGIILIRIMTNLFTPDEYGGYQIALATFGFIRVFSMIWLSTSASRYYLVFKNDNKEQIFISTLLTSTIIGSVIISGIAFIINYFVVYTNPEYSHYSLINIVILASISNTFFEVFIVLFRAGFQPYYYTIYWILFSVGKPVLGVLLVKLFSFRVDGMFWAFVFVPFFLDMILYFHFRIYKNFRLISISTDLLKQFLKYGLPLALSFLSFWVLSFSDRYLIEHYCGSHDVGLYSVGYMISEKTLNFLYMILMLAAYPIIVQNYEIYGREATQRLITQLTRLFLLVCSPIMTILIAIPRDILICFANKEYVDGATVLPLIAIGMFLSGLCQYILKGFELQKKSYMVGFLAVIAGVSNIAMNIILIPQLGFEGAAISACAAYFIYSFGAYVATYNSLRWIPPIASVLRIALGNIGLGLFLSYFSRGKEAHFLSLAFIISLGTIFYVILLLLIKEIERKELSLLFNYLSKPFSGST